ncbi:MAG: hypothetical protein ABSH09_35605 [Bryobacteraceae bacterium]
MTADLPQVLVDQRAIQVTKRAAPFANPAYWQSPTNGIEEVVLDSMKKNLALLLSFAAVCAAQESEDHKNELAFGPGGIPALSQSDSPSLFQSFCCATPRTRPDLES